MRIRTCAAALALLTGIGAAFPHGSAPQATSSSLTQLSWMAGCLELRAGDRLVEEHRMEVRGGSMLGMGRTTSSKGLVEYELTLIQEKAGKIVFEARPSGQPPAVFTASSVGRDSVIFTAPEHDFPQLVGYRRSGRDSVLAWISGTHGGAVRRIEFPYRRVACLGER